MLLLAMSGLIACGDAPSGPSERHWIMQPAAVTLEVGFTSTFEFTAPSGEASAPPDSALTWHVSDSAIATISDDGTVRALAPGTAVVGARASDGTTTEAVVTVTPLRFRQITASVTATCGVSRTNTAYCWGDGMLGRLGTGDEEDRLTPTPVKSSVAFASVSARYQHACGLDVGGTAYCWGDQGDSGRLGNGVESGIVTTPVRVEATLEFASISAGGWITCALALDGSAHCWGLGNNGALGNGSEEERHVPTPVASDLRFTSITTGGLHACALEAESGAAYCWGANSQGELGDGTVDDRSVPTAVAGGLSFRAIAAGIGHTCGVTVDGQGYCWGSNTQGRLGTGNLLDQLAPTRVATDTRLVDIGAATTSTCALDESGHVWCWGSNLVGALGQPPGNPRRTNAPLLVPAGVRYRTITKGAHTCGISLDGLVHCWGPNPWGQFGAGYYSVGSHEPVMPMGQVPPGG